jgi:hypothetical protein
LVEPKPFSLVKLICGIIASEERFFERSEEHLIEHYGPLDLTSPLFTFDFTDYYENQMGQNLKRKFVSFGNLISPEDLSEIKIRTNALEEEIKKEFKTRKRIVNLDPGYTTASALIMATAKDFAHRIPLHHGIYAHLELLFGKNDVRTLSWTYPDFETKGYQEFFLKIRKIYLSQVQNQKSR